MRLFWSAFCLLMCSSLAPAAVTLSSASTLWTAINGNYDYLADQQTGQPSDDIVGNAANPGFFTAFDDAGTPSQTDGFLAFRVRMNAQQSGNGTSYTGYVWVGVDADMDGTVDAYIRHTGGASGATSIHHPGNDLNNSPSTTSIVATAAVSYSNSNNPTHYNYRAVTTNDSPSINIDPNDKGATDWYVSFQLEFSGLVNYLSSQNPSISINQNSPLRYIVATSTQGNSLNQDLGGVPKTYDGTQTWSQLGGFSSFMTGSGQVIPEPSSSLFAMLSGLVLLMRRRRSGN